MLRAAFRKPLVHILLIAAVGLIIYSNTFNVPFQWDEDYYIVNNPIVKDLSYFIKPSSAKGFEQYVAIKNRYVGYLTFALNYKLDGLDVRGYHGVNIAIHLINALLVYYLVALTFRTPFLSRAILSRHAGYISLFTALIFVAHPVQTEAVTYIFQRLASLAALFYLISLVAYISSRLSAGKAKRYSLYAIALTSAVLAMKTKENAFTLPVAITLYELLFFNGKFKWRVIRLIPFILTMLIIPLTIIGTDKPAGEVIGEMKPAMQGYETTDRMDYLFTEFRVVITYLRLVILPVKQNVGYDYPLLQSFFNIHVLMSFMFHLSAFCLVVCLIFRSKREAPDLRILGFGLLWFYLTLSVESSIIPIPMVINEYRLYLPSVGIFLLAATAALMLAEKINKATSLLTSLLVIPLVFAFATYNRNAVWASNESLWEDTVKKSPRNATAYGNLGTAYFFDGMTDKAIENYSKALMLNYEHPDVHHNLGLAYGTKGLTDKAIGHYLSALALKPKFAEAHYDLGVAYESKGLTDKAIVHYQRTIDLKPGYIEAHNNLGAIYRSKGFIDKAIEHYLIALKLKPDSPELNYNLGLAYLKKGLADKANTYFDMGFQLSSGRIVNPLTHGEQSTSPSNK